MKRGRVGVICKDKTELEMVIFEFIQDKMEPSRLI
jgi:hypothetical protein